MSRPLAIALTAVLSACTEAPPADDISNGLRVVGRVDRVEDGAVDWVGVHEVQLVDAEGQVSCARTFDVDALETRAAVACPACGLTLDLADATPVSDDCGDRLGELAERLAPPPLLAFVPAGDRVPVQHGRVVGADDPDGPWATWGSGVLESSGLSWRRDGASPPDVPDDIELPDLRPLHGPPVD